MSEPVNSKTRKRKKERKPSSGRVKDDTVAGPQLDELEALRLQNAAYEAENEEIRKILGDEYVPAENCDAGLEASTYHESFDTLPSWDKKTRVERALELNRRLQSRVHLLLKTIDQSSESHDTIEKMVDFAVVQKKKRKKESAHVHSRSEYTGKSWFWASSSGLIGCQDIPKYNGVHNLLFIAEHLPLVFRSGVWSGEEKEGLKKGVEEVAKERMTNEMIAKVDTIEDFDILQRPLRSLTLDSPQILHIAETFSEEEWSLVASRHVQTRTGNECLLQWNNRINPLLKTTEFDSNEKDALKSYVAQYGENAWETIAKLLPGRTPLDCLKEYKKSRAETKEYRNIIWTDENMENLQNLVLKHGQAWKKIESEFGGDWSAEKLMFIWRKHLQGTGGGKVAPKKGPWSQEEDNILIKAVAISGKEWSKIARLVPGRTEIQCRERYVNHLDPNVRNAVPFTDEENMIIESEVPKYEGGRISWSKIAKLLPGRTDRQCRKAFEKLSRKKARKNE